MSTIETNDLYTREWVVFEEKDTTFDQTPQPITDGICDNIIYKKQNGKYYRRVIANDVINVKWFGAKGDNTTNDTNAVKEAIKVKKNIFFPEGKYLINIEIDNNDINNENNKLSFSGSGTRRTFLKPFDISKAIIVYKTGSPFWTYGTEFKNFSLEGKNRTGIGFSFSKSHENEYTINDEYSGNVIFRNVDFRGLEKGIQALFGNIGIEFYSTGFHSNKYGAYFIDNKFKSLTSGDSMHAGNKYFYGGEISENQIGIYVHDRTDGFGAITFTNVIFEQNNIATYINTNNIYVPIAFDSCWNELNGQIYSKAQLSIDAWNNSIKSTKLVDPHSHIFEGQNSTHYFNNGRVSDIYINGESIIVKATNCYAETNDGAMSSPSIVQGENSFILLSNPITSVGLPTGDNIFVLDSFSYNKVTPVNNIASDSLVRSSVCLPRINKVSDPDLIHKLKSISMETVQQFTGSLNNVDGQLVNDSKLFLKSNKFNLGFTNVNKYMTLKNSNIDNVKKGWYVITFDLKINSGDPIFYLWNGNDFHFMQFKPTIKNKWQTVVSYAYVDKDSTNSLYLEVSENKPTEFLLSAYQILRFDNSMEAKSYIESKNYTL